MIVTGKTKTGFVFSVNANAMYDMEIVDALAEAEAKDPIKYLNAVSKICNKVFGKEKQRLYDHVRTEDGRVPVEAIESEIMDVFNAIGKDGKK